MTMNERRKYICTKTFRVREDIIIKLNDPVEFDGTYLYLKNLKPIEAPNLHHVITDKGWLVLEEEYEGATRPASAPIMVTPATTGNVAPGMSGGMKQPMKFQHFQDEQKYALDRTASIKSLRPINHNQFTQSSAGSAQGGEMNVDNSIQLKVPSKSAGDPFSGQLKSELSDVQITPRKGTSQEELLAQLSPRDKLRREYELAKQSVMVKVRAASNPHEAEAQAMREENMRLHEQFKERLAQMESGHVEAEGITFRNTTASGSIPVSDPVAFVPTPVVAERPKAVPVAAKARKSVDPAVKTLIAKSVLPEFPFDSYDFAAPDHKKLARIDLDFDTRFDVLKAIYAAEDDHIRGHIAENYPDALR